MDNITHQKSIKDKTKNILIILGICAFLVYSVYDMFLKISDEIGFLGAGKVGRQVLIQTFDYEMKPDVKVDSEFFDRPFILRLIIGEPRRTTIRFNIQNENKLKANDKTARTFLNQPAKLITDRFQGKIVMQDNYEITREQLEETMKNKNVISIEDLLTGFGFKKFEIYLLDHPRVEINIKGTKNVEHVGGD